MSEIQQILRDPCFIDLGIAALKTFDSGAVIVAEGSAERSLHLIEQGTARVSERVELEDQRHIQPGLCDLGEGDVFGELSLFEAAPRSASVVAIEPCEVLVFDAEALVKYFDSHPQQGYPVLKGLFRVLSERLRQADRRLGSLFAWGLKAHGIDQHL
jgi:CRP/FNR family transcriptional regulator, cyclic AMP receptor protein